MHSRHLFCSFFATKKNEAKQRIYRKTATHRSQLYSKMIRRAVYSYIAANRMQWQLAGEK